MLPSLSNAHRHHGTYYDNIYVVINSERKWLDVHKWSQARDPVICKIPARYNNQLIEVVEDRGRYKYIRWVKGEGDHRDWRGYDGKPCERLRDGHVVGWIDTHDEHISLKREDFADHGFVPLFYSPTERKPR